MAITDAQVDPEAPITSTLMYSLRDDPAALPISTFTNDSGYFATFSSVTATNSSSTISTSGNDSVTATITISDSDQNGSDVEVDFNFMLDSTVGTGNHHPVRGTATIGTGNTTIHYNYVENDVSTGRDYLYEGSTTSGTFISLFTLKVKITLASGTLAVQVESAAATDWTGADVAAKAKVVKFS